MSVPLMVAGGVKSIIDMYRSEQTRKNQIKGLENLADVTPAEREYVKKRREIMKSGDPVLKEEFSKNISAIRQQGQFNQQRATGQVIQQGLEGSIVAQELRRRVDKDVLQSVAEQARAMAIANARAKQRAESEIEAMNLSTDARRREALSRIASLGGYDKSVGGNLIRLGQVAGSALAGYEGQGFEDFDFGFGDLFQMVGGDGSTPVTGGNPIS